MPRETYVYRDGKVVLKSEAERRYADAPQIIRDGMQAAKHMANGKITDSKSTFRRWTRDHGCVEIGDQPIPQAMPSPKLREDPRAEVARHIERLNLNIR